MTTASAATRSTKQKTKRTQPAPAGGATTTPLTHAKSGLAVQCQQSVLKRGLSVVAHALPAAKSTIPVLNHIAISTDGGRLKLQATNLEIALTCWVGAKIAREGAITVPAKVFSDYVSGVPDGPVLLTLEPTTQILHLQSATSEATFHCIDADEYPTIPTVSAETSPLIAFPPALLREVIAQVAFAAKASPSTPTEAADLLCGVLMKIEGERVEFAAADGKRMSLRQIPLSEPVAEPQLALIPARALIELARVIGDAESDIAISLTPQGGQILFHTSRLEAASRLYEGTFPDIWQCIPKSVQTRIVVTTAEFKAANALAAPFAAASNAIVKLTMEPDRKGRDTGRLILSANAAAVGSNRTAVACTMQGPGGEIALHSKQLAEILDAAGTPKIAFEYQSHTAPGVFKPVGADGFIHLVVPFTTK